MAKSARASTKKTNNSKLKARVFGPVENARTERLSAKLLELASQSKPKEAANDAGLTTEGLPEPSSNMNSGVEGAQDDEMEIDQKPSDKTAHSKTHSKGRIAKRQSRRKASIVFPKYKNSDTRKKSTRRI
ncbi:hypothetical protein F5884DRAFT_90358 [Xylogone sp. PMI_703]|nr:hypothetical protein F5884DRAFT_90358 [Xylogone sp. PMI_703]